MQLGNNIRRLRFENAEMSQEELAEAVGVTRQTIHAIEKGKFIPSALLAFRIARFFGRKPEDVFYIIEEQISNDSNNPKSIQ